MGGWSWTAGLVPVVLLACLTGTMAISKNFVNSSLPDSKYTFVVNFDFSQVICQHSEDKADLHVHEMSILCDGKQDCFTNPAIHDESFPYCEKKCNSTCNDRGACLYDGQQAQCYCNSGFSGPSCELIDKNECLERPCHLMADCLNTPVGYSCACRPGFYGDGYHCADLDECSTPTLCPEHSTCVNLPGTYYCNCSEGFAQKGDSLRAKCLDIDECQLGTHKCTKGQLCENTVGSYTCVSGCTEGYELVNGECKDIDECKRVDLCGARAECFNSPGSYSCVCEEGMTGDGLTCEPITDCSQRENVCDRHAYCLTDFKMCVCAAGFAGDGITCNDVNECEAKAEPCKKQKGTRCVNIVGGHICCAEGSNDERCIEEQGVFCAGGCGAHAYCGNKTCECLPGYSGDPLKKCLDVNECDADGICSGVGQWCVNVMGSFLCCSEHSKEPECQGYHVFTSIDGTTAILQTNSTKQIVVSNEQGEKGVSHHGGFIAVGKGVISKNGSIPSISVLSKRPCSTYCPYNSECVNGYCECSKGFGGNVHLGCEDINECLAGSPCGEETADSWCANTEGSFVCCTRNSSEENCWGLEIFRDADGRVHLSTNQDDDQTFAVALNETDREEFISHTIHEFQNSSEGGAILVVKQRVPTDVAMLKPNAGEMGLEIVGDDIRKETATPEQPTQNTLTPDSPIGANGIVSTLGGLSTTTTSIPVTEILVHTAEKTTLLFKNATTVLVLPSTLSPVEGSSSRSVEDGDMLGKATTSDGHINVRFTTLEEINKNPNETKTTPGPKTVIDGDGTGEESLLSAQKGIGKNVTDGDGTGDVKVVDTLVGTTKSPNKKEVDSEKEGLEIVALPTKPPTETRLEENPGPRTTVSEAEPATSSPTTDFEEGSGDKPKIADKPKITDGEKEGKEKAEKTGTKTVISDREETGTGGPTHLTITSSGEQKAPETDVHGGVGSELIAGESSATTQPITDETGLEIVWKGTPTPSLRSSETTVSPTGSTTSEGIATGSSGSSSSASSGTVVSPSSKEHEPKDGHKQLTITSSGEQRPPETDIHSDDGSESDEGSSGKATTEATTGKIGLEIVGGSTTPLGSSVSDTDLPTVFSTLAGQDPSSDGSSPRTTPSGISSSTKGRQETKTTSSSSTVGGQEASTASSSPSYSTAAETKSTLSGVPSTTPTVLENSTASESEAPSGHQENKTEPSEPSTTGESGSFGSGSNVTIISGSTPEPGTTREGRLHASIGPKTESTTPEAGLEIIPVPTEPITPKSSTVSGQDKIPELMTSETTGSSTPESTAETGLEIIAVTTTSGSISSLSLAATSTESPVSESTAPSVTESSSIGETGLEIVGTSLKPTEATTTQHDLVLSVSPKSEGSSSTTKVVPIVEPVTAAGKIIEPSSTTEQPEIVMSVSTTKRTVKPTGSTESVSTIPVTTDGFTSSASPVTTPNATGPVSSTSEGSIKTPEAATTVSVTPGKTSTDTAETTKKPDGVTTVAVTPEKTSELTFSSSPASISSELPTPESTRSTPEKSTTETDVEMITTEPDVDLTAKPNRAPAEPEATTKDSFELVTPSTPAAASLAPNNVKKCVSSDECGNDALCERRTGACRCLPGFEGTPSTAPCTDVDECAAGLHKCHETARCHNIIGTYACFCPMGYRKNELGVCVDINECEESRGNCCSSNGTCVNKEGSYGCECKPGFIGDGYKCMPLEKRSCSEAELAKAGCGSHHVCMVDGSGTADCNTCSMGFKLVEGKCSDINECSEPELNMCSKNADCNNLLGTYACSCRSGFKGDGYICEDIDECSTSPCHPQAECENLFGSFKCSCPSGFTGDGLKECKNPLERSCENVKEFCGRVEHTACLSVRIFNGSLSSVCECEPGYRINKETNQCEDINECDENRHNCDPASSVCVNEYGGFRCDCAEGYEGAGGVCVDVNECERGTAGCHAMAMCLNQPGSCGCKCMSGFTGDGTQCNPMQKREEDNSCTAEWDRLCLLENKTCHVDEEDVPQCGSCIEGHHPINGSCQPVHGAGTCADPSKNTCHKNAECIDIPGTPGKHFCTCKKGFIGDGIRCDDIDECSLTGICNPHATCLNLPGSFNCTCNDRFVGNGFTCTRATGPNCHLNAGLCQKDAECTMDGLCKCKKGFDGDGFKDCKELTGSSTAPEIAGKRVTTTTVESIVSEETTVSTTEQPDLILTGSTKLPSTKGSAVEVESPKTVELVTGSARLNVITTPGPEPPNKSQVPMSTTTRRPGSTESPTAQVTVNASTFSNSVEGSGEEPTTTTTQSVLIEQAPLTSTPMRIVTETVNANHTEIPKTVENTSVSSVPVTTGGSTTVFSTTASVTTEKTKPNQENEKTENSTVSSVSVNISQTTASFHSSKETVPTTIPAKTSVTEESSTPSTIEQIPLDQAHSSSRPTTISSSQKPTLSSAGQDAEQTTSIISTPNNTAEKAVTVPMESSTETESPSHQSTGTVNTRVSPITVLPEKNQGSSPVEIVQEGTSSKGTTSSMSSVTASTSTTFQLSSMNTKSVSTVETTPNSTETSQESTTSSMAFTMPGKGSVVEVDGPEGVELVTGSVNVKNASTAGTTVGTPTGKIAIIKVENPEDVEMVTGSVRVNFSLPNGTNEKPKSSPPPSTATTPGTTKVTGKPAVFEFGSTGKPTVSTGSTTVSATRKYTVPTATGRPTVSGFVTTGKPPVPSDINSTTQPERAKTTTIPKTPVSTTETTTKMATKVISEQGPRDEAIVTTSSPEKTTIRAIWSEEKGNKTTAASFIITHSSPEPTRTIPTTTTTLPIEIESTTVNAVWSEEKSTRGKTTPGSVTTQHSRQSSVPENNGTGTTEEKTTVPASTGLTSSTTTATPEATVSTSTSSTQNPTVPVSSSTLGHAGYNQKMVTTLKITEAAGSSEEGSGNESTTESLEGSEAKPTGGFTTKVAVYSSTVGLTGKSTTRSTEGSTVPSVISAEGTTASSEPSTTRGNSSKTFSSSPSGLKTIITTRVPILTNEPTVLSTLLTTNGLFEEVTSSVSPSTKTMTPTTHQPTTTNGNTTPSAVVPDSSDPDSAAPPSMTPISFETTELPMPTTEQEGYDSTTEKETTTTATTQGENSTSTAPLEGLPEVDSVSIGEKRENRRSSTEVGSTSDGTVMYPVERVTVTVVQEPGPPGMAPGKDPVQSRVSIGKTPFPLEYLTPAPFPHPPTEAPFGTSSHSPEVIDSNGAYFPAPSIVTDDGVEVRTEAVGTRKEHPQREGLKRCSTEDRSKCHEFAICDLSTSSCRCKDGFEGDGYRVCRQVASLDCVFNSTVCHSDAFCDRHTRKCSCATGYIGDGILCSPDPQDCILRKLCSTDAVCSGRRCRCVEGFTGDGIKCVSLHQRSANCSECDVNAHCNQGVCACNTGYFGNGLCCVPDPRDCVHFPGTCHPEATCNRESRQCICRRGYLGDGISCFPTVSCVTEASVCHRNAICLPSGHCMCRNGFQGNGHSCQPTSAIGLYPLVHDTPSLCGNRCNKESELCIEGDCVCKHGFKKIGSICQDVDECLALPCHNLASCQNTKGSYSCSCPEGYVGDGKTCVQHLKIGELGVFCENDGMTLVLSNDTQMFEGKMYVRGQAENPNCIKTFSPLQQHSRPYTFKVFFEHCNVQLLENNTFAATVIVQKHPHFITTSADSYDLKCTYSPGVAQVHSHVNVSELAPTSTLSNQFDGPTCSLKITDDHQDFVESAKVGQSMVLRLEVAPNGTFGILPRDCVAVNIETGERYQLTDKHGCAVDDQLFPEFSQVSASSTQAVFRTFKWPDSSMIRFQCDCKACVGPCPAPDCRKRALPRFRRAHFDEDIDQEVEGLNKVVDTNRKAFSRLLTVHEDSQELLAQEEVEHWNRARSVLSESLPSVSDFEAEGVCVRTAVLAGAALLLLLSVGFLTSTALRRRSTPPKSPSTPISVISL